MTVQHFPSPDAAKPTLPSAQPMDPAMKRLYTQVLLVVGIALIGLNIMYPYPAPLGCRSDMLA